METILTPIKKEPSNGSFIKNQKRIESHKKAAIHFEAAAKHHRDAAKQYEAGNYEKAAQSAIAAHEQAAQGSKVEREVLNLNSELKVKVPFRTQWY